MTTVASRAAGAIVGSIIADAATLPVHWVYDQEVLAQEVSKHPAPEFLPEMVCPFYHLPTGRNSAYGDHLYALLKAMVVSKGFDRGSYQDSLLAMFGTGSAYDYERGDRPVKGPWLAGTMRKFLANVASGKEDTGDTGSTDCDGVDNTAVMVALYAGDPQLNSKVEEMVKVAHNTPVCIKYALTAAKLLEGYILNGPSPVAVETLQGSVDSEVAAEIGKALALKDTPHNDAAKGLGYQCSLPGNFLTMLHCLVSAPPPTGPGGFAGALRPTLLAGGDNCSRAVFLGACLGAQVGLEGIPQDLLAKTERGKEVWSLAEQLVGMRK